MCWVSYYTDSGAQLVYMLVVTLALLFIPHVTLYENKLTMSAFFERMLNATVLFVLTSFLAIIIMYISQLHKQMST